MTGVSAFVFFFTSKKSSQSFTRTSQGRRDEYGEYEIIEHNGYTVKHYIASGTLHSMPKDIPVYPEPEGDPSY